MQKDESSSLKHWRKRSVSEAAGRCKRPGYAVLHLPVLPLLSAGRDTGALASAVAHSSASSCQLLLLHELELEIRAPACGPDYHRLSGCDLDREVARPPAAHRHPDEHRRESGIS